MTGFILTSRLIKKRNAFLIVTFLFFVYSLKAQLITSYTMTPTQLVQNVLAGTGITVSNVTYAGSANAIGLFNGSKSNIGLSKGVILATGAITRAIGPNNDSAANFDFGLPGDADLGSIVNPTLTFDAAVLEFDFIPSSDTVIFKYVFGSEEYPLFVDSAYNDVFGFFISGPGISGPYSNSSKNIAIIPGTSLPVNIHNINSKKTPVILLIMEMVQKPLRFPMDKLFDIMDLQCL